MGRAKSLETTQVEFSASDFLVTPSSNSTPAFADWIFAKIQNSRFSRAFAAHFNRLFSLDFWQQEDKGSGFGVDQKAARISWHFQTKQNRTKLVFGDELISKSFSLSVLEYLNNHVGLEAIKGRLAKYRAEAAYTVSEYPGHHL